jgi:CBS domain-containing protein
MRRTVIPGVIDGCQALCCMPKESTAQDAAMMMREHRVGAAMVMEGGRLIGIVTERDLVNRLLAMGGDARTTRVGELMTGDPETVAPDDPALLALDRMRSGHYRHLPVLRDHEVCGMVSIRDLYEAVRQGLEEELTSAESLIYGEQYGIAAQ